METPVQNTGLVTDAHRQQFASDGYMVLEAVIPGDLLELLRQECSYFLGYYDGQMDAAGETVQGINHRGSRYFISNRYRLSPRMWEFIFSPLMAEIATAALGPDVFLFHEQWVLKGAEQGMKFAWHQDSGYVKSGDPGTVHPPYLTCWCTLDAVSEENGTVYVLPHDRGDTRDTIYTHTREEGSNDLIGYTGDDPGIPITAPAGSVVAFTSYNFHRSGANTSSDMRRVYLPQYSKAPIMRSDGSGHWGMAVPFVRDNTIIYNRTADTAAAHGGVA
jgi:ectoine hydroxylase-related dioxygenase (phytanoyl-CoA dioxygenase family)